MEVVLTNTFQNEFVEKMEIVKQQYARQEIVSAMRAMTSAPPCSSSYWRLGDGSTYTYANNGTFTGAFRVYDRYHDAKARAKVQADIEAEFQQAAA